SGPVIGLNLGGARFEAREKNGSSETMNVSVLDAGDGAVNWQAAIVSGANWLSLGATAGQATPSTPSLLPLSVNPGALAPGAYYALVKISDARALNNPQYLMAVLNVVSADNPPNPDPDPEGLFFVAKTGGASPPAQSVRVFTSSSSPAPYQASANTS